MSSSFGFNKIFFNPRVQSFLRWSWLILVILGLTFVAVEIQSGRTFDTSIVALLPDDQQDPMRQLANNKLLSSGEERLIFLIASTDKQRSLESAKLFADFLRSTQLFTSIQGAIDAGQIDRWQNEIWPYRYNFLPKQSITELSTVPINAQHPVLQRAFGRLYSPIAASVSGNLLADPLQLFYQWQMDLGTQSNFSVDNNWLSREIDGKSYRMIAATLADNAYDIKYQRQVLSAVADAGELLPEEVAVLSSGLLFHAAHGATQAQREISTIGLGSLIGISLVLMFVLRRVGSVLLAFLPIAIGLLFSLALCLLLFDSLHLITLAFGAGLVGVAIDYSLHYICANYEPANSQQKISTLRKIMPAISLGLVSSVIAYAAQTAAPFPGLRQMAAFSVFGLIGAWLTVVLWLPVLSRRGLGADGLAAGGIADGIYAKGSAVDATGKDSDLGLLRVLGLLLSRWPTTKSTWVKVVLGSVASLSVILMVNIQVDDDVRRLQTSPAAMLEKDARVQTLIGGINPGQYFVLSGDNIEDLLQMEESFAADLDQLIQAGELSGFQSLAKFVPSLKQQQHNRSLLDEKVYSDRGLLTLLAEQLESAEIVTRGRELFSNNDKTITLEDWQRQSLAESQSYLWLGGYQQQVHGLVALSGIRDSAVIARLEQLANSVPGVVFVDNVGAISNILQRHRQQLQRWLVLAYGIVLGLLILRYGFNAWRLLAAPALASAIALAILSASQVTLNIFNLLALLLVLGIGMDASIFLNETKRSIYTWLAVSLSAATTLLAFGLLALSATPVLHQFGITVLLGIVGVWLLAPCFIESETDQRKMSLGHL